jgi:hypothetical protein
MIKYIVFKKKKIWVYFSHISFKKTPSTKDASMFLVPVRSKHGGGHYMLLGQAQKKSFVNLIKKICLHFNNAFA